MSAQLSTLARLTASALSATVAGRNVLRDLAGAPRHVPIDLTEGRGAPAYVGESYYWTTPCSARVRPCRGHRRVAHPSAYGWPCQYHASSLRVAVGRDWRPHVGLAR